ncbi:MAG TPA: hypothetical protein PLO65_12790, partial [Caulobacter sp.]|nr:hypothetical protein [Caulobacter sp.]
SVGAVLLVAGLVLAGLCGLWWLGGREPVYRISRGEPVWFVATRGAGTPALAPGVRINWAARPDFGFVGPADPWWDRVLLLSGGAVGQPPVAFGAGVDDAMILRLALMRPPRLALGLLRGLLTLGILRPPTGPVAEDLAGMGLRPDLMPDRDGIARLLARPADYRPAMVNFLRYFDAARYAEPRPDARPSTGAAAYRRYGVVAMRTVYQTRGFLAFYGQVSEIVRPAAAGPAIGTWDDVAVMQYRRPEGILTMEHVPRYRAALAHRDAGLERTLVIAATADGPAAH